MNKLNNIDAILFKGKDKGSTFFLELPGQS